MFSLIVILNISKPAWARGKTSRAPPNQNANVGVTSQFFR